MVCGQEIKMRSNVYDSVPGLLRETLASGANAACERRDHFISATPGRAQALATALAALMLIGFAVLVVVGLVAVFGAVGFGIWQLWA
jgi:uncharacterized paraquat-inducible protein A